MALDSSDRSAIPRVAAGTRAALVVSSYHSDLTGAMAASARATLVEAGVAEGDVTEIVAPGAYELPILAQALAERDDVDTVLCFGLVLRGETDHDRYISSAVADALQRVGLDSRKPVLFGVLTTNTLEQAIARARTADEGGLDKGREVALAAIGALNGLAQIRSGQEAHA